MKKNDFDEALRKYVDADELSVHSEGGYNYAVVDETGKKLNPAQLGIKLDSNLDGGDYVRVDVNIYSQTAAITLSDDASVDGHVRNVTQDGNSDAVIVEGDVP